ncbi:MAG: enoyl-CoA hydratase/isomerase family protein [Frankiales bacterium]|jgi:enoyl-CoA hydratase|nr:enoyl-CoA hydratase/isomerase family protein [Frankiales bacterium]
MLYLGERLDAAQALAAGLVDAVREPGDVLDAALAVAATIGRRSWRALELTTLSLRSGAPDTTSFDITAQALPFDSGDKRERMTASWTGDGTDRFP